MKLNLFLLSFLISNFAFGQNINFGINAEFGVNTVVGNHERNLDPRSDLVDKTNHLSSGFTSGFTLGYEWNNGFKIEADIFIDKREYETRFKSLNQEELSLIDQYKLNYISFPVKIGYNFGEKVNYFVNLGLMPSKLRTLKNEFFTFNDTLVASSGALVLSPVKSKTDIGGIIEIGANFKIIDKIKLITSIYYYESFSKMYGNLEEQLSINFPDVISDERRWRKFSVRLGIRYYLKTRKK